LVGRARAAAGRAARMSYLSIQGVGKRFGGLQALSDVSFDVAEGEIVGLMGANGAGKTTLFSLIAGHARPSEGDIKYRGRSIVGLRPDQICRCGIARTFQIVKPFGGLTVIENLMTAALFGAQRAHSREEARQRGLAILHELGMERMTDVAARALTLSGQKKLELARAIATGGRVIMLDEVMAGLTPTEMAEMIQILRHLHQSRELTILIIEHVMKALMHLSHRVLVLHLGKVVACASPEQIAADPRVQEIYMGKTA